MVPLKLTPPILPLDLTFKQGADVPGVVLTVVDDSSQPIQVFTGYSVRAQIRATSGGLVLFEWNSNGAPGLGTVIFTPAPPVSTITLVVTNAQSSGFLFQSAQWDCFVTNPSGQETCLAEGIVSIDPAVTHS